MRPVGFMEAFRRIAAPKLPAFAAVLAAWLLRVGCSMEPEWFGRFCGGPHTRIASKVTRPGLNPR